MLPRHLNWWTRSVFWLFTNKVTFARLSRPDVMSVIFLTPISRQYCKPYQVDPIKQLFEDLRCCHTGSAYLILLIASCRPIYLYHNISTLWIASLNTNRINVKLERWQSLDGLLFLFLILMLWFGQIRLSLADSVRCVIASVQSSCFCWKISISFVRFTLSLCCSQHRRWMRLLVSWRYFWVPFDYHPNLFYTLI